MSRLINPTQTQNLTPCPTPPTTSLNPQTPAPQKKTKQKELSPVGDMIKPESPPCKIKPHALQQFKSYADLSVFNGNLHKSMGGSKKSHRVADLKWTTRVQSVSTVSNTAHMEGVESERVTCWRWHGHQSGWSKCGCSGEGDKGEQGGDKGEGQVESGDQWRSNCQWWLDGKWWCWFQHKQLEGKSKSSRQI